MSRKIDENLRVLTLTLFNLIIISQTGWDKFDASKGLLKAVWLNEHTFIFVKRKPPDFFL